MQRRPVTLRRVPRKRERGAGRRVRAAVCGPRAHPIHGVERRALLDQLLDQQLRDLRVAIARGVVQRRAVILRRVRRARERGARRCVRAARASSPRKCSTMTSDAVSLADSALGRLSVGALRGVKRARLMGVVASVVASVAAVTVDGVATVDDEGEGALASRNAASTASIDSSVSPIKSK